VNRISAFGASMLLIGTLTLFALPPCPEKEVSVIVVVIAAVVVIVLGVMGYLMIVLSHIFQRVCQ